MAQHKVNFDLPSRPLSRQDIIFTVEEDGDKLGELRVSSGALVWFPKNKKIGYRMRWKKLDELFQEHGRHKPTR